MAVACFDVWVRGLRLLVSQTPIHPRSSLLRMVCGPIVMGTMTLFAWTCLYGRWKSSGLEMLKCIPPVFA